MRQQVFGRRWTHAFMAVAAATALFAPVGCKSQKPADANAIPEQPAYIDKADASAKSTSANSGSTWKEAGESSAKSAPLATSDAAPSGQRTHTVKKGDTIYSLARQYYGGDVHKWHSIYDANRNVITNPDQLKVGQVLVIPG